MQKFDEKYYRYIQILKDELIPAMGCTEPIALAYAAAKLREVLGNMPTYVNAYICGNIIKNVKSVIVPQTKGMKGIEAAITAGLFANKASQKLEVLSYLNEADLDDVNRYIRNGSIKVFPAANKSKLYIELIGYYNNHEVKIIIKNSHTNIVYIEKNKNVLFEANVIAEEKKNENYNCLNVSDIVSFSKIVDLEPLQEILEKQINYNLAIALEGLKNDYGANIGKVLLDSYQNTVDIKARAYAAAASDARMSGCSLPVVIISGSGNQGITASLPIYVYAKEWNSSKEEMLRALIISDLVTLELKKGIGRLSAFCGATVAGIGAAAGITYLDGGDYKSISHTIVNALGIISGMICDGAKASCAAKISSAIEAGILGYNMYKNKQQFRSGDGLIIKGVDNTIDNVGKMARFGMEQTDEEILRIMMSSSCVD